MSKSWLQVSFRCLCCLISICASDDFFFFFFFASANSNNHPSKGVRPHNTRQIISAAYSLYSAAVSHECSDKHLLVQWPIYVSTFCREEYYCASKHGSHFVCPHTHTNKPNCIYTLELTYRTHMHGCTGQGLFQDEVGLFQMCYTLS